MSTHKNALLALVLLSSFLFPDVTHAASSFDDAAFERGKEVVQQLIGWHTRSFSSSDKMIVAPYGIRLHGMRRKVMVVQSMQDPTKHETYVSEAVSHKICDTLDFLVEASKSPVLDATTRASARAAAIRYADNLIGGMQNASGPFAGGFRLSETEELQSTKTTAYCGLALLKTWKAYGDQFERFLTSAESAGNFLRKMEEPRLFGGSLASFVFVKDDGSTSPTIGMWVDEAWPSTKQINVSSSLWNVLAVQLMDELDQYGSSSWVRRSAAQRTLELNNYVYGATNAYTGYTPKYTVDSTKSIRINGAILNSDNDNTWKHTQANVLGSDQPEYVINVLYALKDSRAKQLYDAYQFAPEVIKVGQQWQRVAKGTYDPFIGWGGTFSRGSFDAGDVWRPGIGSSIAHMRPGYDFDAITANVRAAYYPEEVLAALAPLLVPHDVDPLLADSKMKGQSRWLYALLDLDLDPYKSTTAKFLDSKELAYLNGNGNDITWLANEPVSMYSRSTTAAHNGVLLLRGLEYYAEQQ